MRPPCTRSLLLLCPFLLFFFVVSSASAQNFVYTDNNTFPTNSVTAFSVAANGALTNIGTFLTGGSGNVLGQGAPNRARICAARNRLYVSNDWSGDVSGFEINPMTGALSLIPGSPFSAGGVGVSGMSLDCTPNGQFLIAANAASNNIAVFGIDAIGALTPIPGSPFPAGGSKPDSVRVSPNGRFLSVALVDNDAVAMFGIGLNGALTQAPGSPFASPANGAVSAVDINCAGNLLYAVQASDGANVDAFSIGSNGALTLVQTFNNSAADDNSNVCVLSPNDQFLFVSSRLSNSVNVFSVAPNGTLSLIPDSPFGGTGGEPFGLATDAGGTILFTANFDNSTVTSFSIAGNGALSPVGAFSTGQRDFSGLLSLAVFPGKGCSKAFDICLQDDSTPGLLLRFNSVTGDYLFTKCGPKGFALSGKGSVSRMTVCTIDLRDSRMDRFVTASFNQCQRSGTASLQINGTFTTTTYPITDRKTVDDSCACSP